MHLFEGINKNEKKKRNQRKWRGKKYLHTNRNMRITHS
jgi:hypothetical protein